VLSEASVAVYNVTKWQMVGVDDSSLQTDSQPKSVVLIRGSAAWRCSTFIRWTVWILTITSS